LRIKNNGRVRARFRASARARQPERICGRHVDVADECGLPKKEFVPSKIC